MITDASADGQQAVSQAAETTRKELHPRQWE